MDSRGQREDLLEQVELSLEVPDDLASLLGLRAIPDLERKAPEGRGGGVRGGDGDKGGHDGLVPGNGGLIEEAVAVDNLSIHQMPGELLLVVSLPVQTLPGLKPRHGSWGQLSLSRCFAVVYFTLGK